MFCHGDKLFSSVTRYHIASIISVEITESDEAGDYKPRIISGRFFLSAIFARMNFVIHGVDFWTS